MVDNKFRIRCIKLVNSAISWTDPIVFPVGKIGDLANEYYNKAHGYVNKRPGLINNAYAIKYELAKLIDLVYYDVDTSIKQPAADIILINNNSKFDYDTKANKLLNVKLQDDEFTYLSKSKHILFIDRNDGLKLREITLDELQNIIVKE